MTMIDRVVQAVRQNPEGLLLLGAGVALMLRSVSTAVSETGASKRSGAHAPQRRGRLAFERPDEADKRNSSFGQTLSAGVSDAQDAVVGAAQNLGETVSELGQATADGARRLAGGARNSVEDFIDTHPVSIGIAGVAAGCLAAAFLPTSRLETETLSPFGKQAVDAISNVGERVKDATVRAGEQLKDAAADRGLSKQGLSDVARDMASDFKNNVIGDREAPTLAPAGTSNGR